MPFLKVPIIFDFRKKIETWYMFLIIPSTPLTFVQHNDDIFYIRYNIVMSVEILIYKCYMMVKC